MAFMHCKIFSFYTMFSNNNNTIRASIGTYKELSKKTVIASNTGERKKFLEYYVPFKKISELYNWVNYMKTFFVQTCFYLNKPGMSLLMGELLYIPWFDFSDEHFSKSPSEIDDYLFEKYIPEVDEETGITRDEIRKHIEEILPDYYGIRKG